MAAVVLDKFVIELGFEIAALRKGQAEALSRLDGLEKGADHAKKSVAESGKGMGETFSAVRNQVFALTSAFIGFNALKSAVVDITKADSALGRLSRNLSLAPADIKAFEGVGARYGASADEMDEAFSHIANVMSQKKEWGIVDPEMSTALGRAGVDLTTFLDTGISDIDRFMLVHDALNKKVKEGALTRADAINYGEKMGFSSKVVTVMLDTKDALTGLIAAQREMNKVNDADTAQAALTEKAWNTATNTLEHYYRSAKNGIIEMMSAEARAAREKEGQIPTTWQSVGADILTGKTGIIGLMNTLRQIEHNASAVTKADMPPSSTPASQSSGAAFTPAANAHVNERNNNPGNIEYGAFARSHGATGSDGRFAIFPDLAVGAAAQRDLMLYHGAHGARSLRDLITKWSPPSDNAPGNTEAYITDVAQQTGLNPNAPLDYGNPAVMSSVQLAKARHEGMSPRGMAAMQGVIPSATRAGGAGAVSTTTVTNNVTNNIDATGVDANALHDKLQNNFTLSAAAIAQGYNR